MILSSAADVELCMPYPFTYLVMWDKVDPNNKRSFYLILSFT